MTDVTSSYILGDMIAYTKENGPKIWSSVDYINVSSSLSFNDQSLKESRLTYFKVMSYDLMNRRDTVTKHHTSVVDSAEVVENYLAIGAPPEKMNRKPPHAWLLILSDSD
jgi:chitinase